MATDNKKEYDDLIGEVISNTTGTESLYNQSSAMQQVSAADTSVNPRTPAPKNITEVGGYINLMMKMNKRNQLLKQQMLQKTLESILGLKSQTSTGWMADTGEMKRGKLMAGEYNLTAMEYVPEGLVQ